MSLIEIAVVVVLVLVVVGPEKLPELMRWLGRGMREIQRATNLFRDTMMMEGEHLPGTETFQEEPTEAAPVDLSDAPEHGPESVDHVGPHGDPGAQMRPVGLEPVLTAGELESVELAPAEPTEDLRRRYLSPPHRNLY